MIGNVNFNFMTLKSTICGLFNLNRKYYNFINILSKDEQIQNHMFHIIFGFLGDITDFQAWLDVELYIFFESFAVTYLNNANMVMRRRRSYILQELNKMYKKRTYKLLLCTDLYFDICSCIASFSGGQNNYDNICMNDLNFRRLVFLNCIKNNIFRSFMIDGYFHPSLQNL